MPALVTFPDFMQSGPPAYLTGPKVLRYAPSYQRHAWTYLTRGKNMEVMKDHGTDIREKAMFTEESTFESYGPNDTATASMPQNVTTLVANWRYARDQMTWTEEELDAAGSASSNTPQVYYDFQTKLETRFVNSTVQGMERKFLAVPNPNTCEVSTGSEPYPLHFFINDHPNTLWGSGTNSSDAVAATTVMGVSPTAGTTLRHKNRVFGYDVTTAKPTDGSQRNMLNALDDAMIQLQYVSPAASGIYKTPASFEDSGWPTKVLLLGQRGMNRVMNILRGRNDTWNNPGAAGLTGVVFNGHEFVPCPRLDELAVYVDAGNALATEGASGADGRGPRILIVDTDATKAVFNPKKFFERKEPRPWPSQPTTWTVWGLVSYNFVCPHRWTCGIVTPGAVTGTFPSETLTAAQVYAAY